jgi:hypothetical protein
VGPEQLARGLLNRPDEILDAPFDQTEDPALDLALLDVVEVQVEEELLATRADAPGDDPPHAQRDARAPEAGDVVEAALRSLFVLHAEARAKLLLAGDLEAAVLRDVGDQDLGEVVGQLGILLGRSQDQDGHLLAGARGSGRRREGQAHEQRADGRQAHRPHGDDTPQVPAAAVPPSSEG